MSFCLFLLYYLICSLILGLVLLFVYRFIVKRKCHIIERTAEKAIDDYFNSYDSFFPKQWGSDNVNDSNR